MRGVAMAIITFMIIYVHQKHIDRGTTTWEGEVFGGCAFIITAAFIFMGL